MGNWYGHTVSSAGGTMLVGAAPNATYNGLTNTVASKSMYLNNYGDVVLPAGFIYQSSNFFNGTCASTFTITGGTGSLYLTAAGALQLTGGVRNINFGSGDATYFKSGSSNWSDGTSKFAELPGSTNFLLVSAAGRLYPSGGGWKIEYNGNAEFLNASAVSGTSSAVLSSTGGLLLSGLAVRYEDAQVQITQAKQGLIDHPPWNYATGTLDFPQNDPSEYVEFNVQFPHSRQLGSPIHPHVHWLQSANQQVTWVLDYDHIPAGGTASAPYGTRVTMTTNAYSYSSGTLSQLTGTATGLMLTGDTASSILRCKLYRSDNVYSGAAPVTAIDFHYHVDTPGGSATIGAK